MTGYLKCAPVGRRRQGMPGDGHHDDRDAVVGASGGVSGSPLPEPGSAAAAALAPRDPVGIRQAPDPARPPRTRTVIMQGLQVARLEPLWSAPAVASTAGYLASARCSPDSRFSHSAAIHTAANFALGTRRLHTGIPQRRPRSSPTAHSRRGTAVFLTAQRSLWIAAACAPRDPVAGRRRRRGGRSAGRRACARDGRTPERAAEQGSTPCWPRCAPPTGPPRQSRPSHAGCSPRPGPGSRHDTLVRNEVSE